MIKINESGEIIVYIMEPEEELNTLRFIALHKPAMIVVTPNELWNSDFSMDEIASELGLRDGYGVHFHGLRMGDFV